MTTEVACELDAADELQSVVAEAALCFSLTLDAEPVEPAKLHDDFTLADWKRAFANYDRKPWQS